MNSSLIIILLSLVSLSAGASFFPYGTDKYQPPYGNNSKILDKDLRIKYAKSFVSSTQEWSNKLSRLSPAEEEWLQKEIEAGGERRSKAYISKEHSTYELTKILDKNIEILNILANNSARDEKAEIYFWSWFAMNILDQNFISSTVKLSTKFNSLPPSLFGTTQSTWHSVNNDQWVYHMCSTNAQDILYYIVLPYLRGK